MEMYRRELLRDEMMEILSEFTLYRMFHDPHWRFFLPPHIPSSFRCDEMLLDHTGRVSLDVVWSARDEPAIPHLLDNTQEISIEVPFSHLHFPFQQCKCDCEWINCTPLSQVYKCDEIASDCGTCLTLDTSKFACGWCEVRSLLISA